jgi:predicted metalloprotease with PDZ domain
MSEDKETHRYKIVLKDPGAHLFEVSLTVANPDRNGQLFRLPAWIPGSYLIRDFARNLVSMRAESEGEEVEIIKPDKSSWLCAACEAPVTIVCEVYAYDLSVRGAHFDTTHAYFNGPSVFLAVVGQEDRACELDICPPAEALGEHWRVATSMQAASAQKYGFGTYRAVDYAELIDHPVEIGELLIGEFEVDGVPHAIAVRGKTSVDMARICADLTTLCAQQMTLLGKPANLDRYLFLLLVLPDGYGGLEHRWSSSLVCSRNDLPRRGDSSVSTGYRKFLGLVSHEYFHLWNVTRMKPAVFTPYRLQAEVHTGLLWVFEGITSYYDDLALVRSGLIGTDSYLELLGQTITRVVRAGGRLRQSVEESSFDAWTKFYKQDANSANFIVSYYTKGSLIACALDLTLRRMTHGEHCLDDVMRECWRRYGESGTGMPERGLETVAHEVSGMDLEDFFDHYVRGTNDVPLDKLLLDCGIRLCLRPASNSKDAGGKPAEKHQQAALWVGAGLVPRGNRSVLNRVVAGSPAERAGLSPGDEVVALNDLKVSAANFDKRLSEYHVGEKVVLRVFRRDELMSLPLVLQQAPEDTCYLVIDDDASAAAENNRRSWLCG